MIDERLVILDTDIGSDVDDCLALGVILGTPGLRLAAVTTVYGDVALRARMALKLLALRGAAGVPVAMGARKPLLGKRPVWWAGHEGQGLLGPEDEGLRPAEEHAVDLIVRSVMAQPGEVTLIAIGPLTNIALALLREPRLAQNLAQIVIMGGVVGGAYALTKASGEGRYSALALPWVEHNFACDPEAAHVVLSAGAPLTIVPLDVTMQVRIRGEDVDRLAAVDDAYHAAVAEQVRLYPRFAARGWTHLHDPLAVACLLDPSLVHCEPVHAVVETGGEHTAGMLLVSLPRPDAPATALVALEVDAGRAERTIVEHLLN